MRSGLADDSLFTVLNVHFQLQEDMNSIILISETYYITLLQHLNIYRVSHFPHQNHVLKNLPQKSFKMFESKRMIRASTPHIQAKISAKVLIHLIRSRRNLTSFHCLFRSLGHKNWEVGRGDLAKIMRTSRDSRCTSCGNGNREIRWC